MNRYSTKGLPLLKPSRALKFKQRTKFSMIRIFMSALLLAGATFTIFMVMWGGSARAIETTTASALQFEEKRAKTASLLKSPQASQSDPCRSILKTRLSPGASSQGYSDHANRGAISADKKAASVALALFLGARLALGPKEMIQDQQQAQIEPEFQATNENGNNYALRISAYRSCKNNHVLQARL